MRGIQLLRHTCAALALALVPLSSFAAAGPAAAETGEAPDAAYADLYSAMQESVDQEQMADGALQALARQFAATPAFAGAEARSPGLIAEVTAGLRPIFVAQSKRVRQLYRPATLALFARHLTAAEAGSIAAFYRSDIGRKLMGGLARNYSPDATLSNLAEDGPVTREQVEADISQATGAALSALTPEDMTTLGEMAMANPALLKISLIGKGVQELRVQMENEPLTAEEDAAVVAVIEDVFNRRFGAQ
ncbi:MAG: DUF2059 domain-containing protein [Erythrobacter sp.]|jgi:hypothetical protein|nr:DUF2059 domain-containing protein [Erythrobacter sp.]